MKSWDTFARNASLWIMDITNGTLRIEPKVRDSRGALRPTRTPPKLPDGSTADDLIDRMIAILQDAAVESGR